VRLLSPHHLLDHGADLGHQALVPSDDADDERSDSYKARGP
jgi:hypothetical protein